jgi:hypothetical protein
MRRFCLLGLFAKIRLFTGLAIGADYNSKNSGDDSLRIKKPAGVIGPRAECLRACLFRKRVGDLKIDAVSAYQVSLPAEQPG